MKKSKQAYYDKYFEKNWNNIKNTWKGIKSTKHHTEHHGAHTKGAEVVMFVMPWSSYEKSW